MTTNIKLFYACSVLLSLMLLASCASMEGKFTKTKSLNVSTFTDYTITIFAESNLNTSKDKAVYTRQFFDPSGKEEREFVELIEESQLIFKRLVKYAVTLTTISEQYDNDPDRIAAFAQHLEKVNTKSKGAFLDPAYFEEIITKVREQEDLLLAVQAARPILDAVVRHNELLISRLDEASYQLMLKIDSKIQKKYEKVIAFQKALDGETDSVLEAQALLYRTYKGDKTAFNDFRNSNVVLNKKLIPTGEPSEKDLQQLAEHLMVRLEALHTIWERIEPDWKNYRASIRETKTLQDDYSSKTRKARLFLILWLSAHHKMAEGISNPAAWFDIEDASTMLIESQL